MRTRFRNKKYKLTSFTTPKERVLLGVFFIMLGFGLILLSGQLLKTSTQPKGEKGGFFSEGIGSQPRSLNPLFANQANISQPTTPLVFSSLVKFSPQGKIIMDLAKDFEIKKEGRVFIFRLRKNVKWHDGQPLTAKDVAFTIDQVQNNKATPFKLNWEGVEYEILGPYEIKFNLPNPYPPFIVNASLLPILPRHILSSSHKLELVGSGPYKVTTIRKTNHHILKVLLTANPYYYKKKPSITQLTLKYYPNPQAAYLAFKRGEVDSVYLSQTSSTASLPGYNVYKALLPRYFAIFFNPNQNPLLQEKKVRQGLALAIDKNKLIKTVIKGQAVPINYPLPQFIISNRRPSSIPPTFNPQKAKQMLEPYQNAEIVLTTSKAPLLQDTAYFIKKSWSQFGIKVKVETVPFKKLLAQVIKPRKYEALLFGQSLSFEPDPFSFWHSTQVKHPGLNLSAYQNSEVDRILEQARQSLDVEARIQLYNKFNEIVSSDYPACFLYSPYFVYVARSEIKGVNIQQLNLPQDRFNEANKWYVNRRREWK